MGSVGAFGFNADRVHLEIGDGISNVVKAIPRRAADWRDRLF
jgi:hypothetical protein